MKIVMTLPNEVELKKFKIILRNRPVCVGYIAKGHCDKTWTVAVNGNTKNLLDLFYWLGHSRFAHAYSIVQECDATEDQQSIKKLGQ